MLQYVYTVRTCMYTVTMIMWFHCKIVQRVHGSILLSGKPRHRGIKELPPLYASLRFFKMAMLIFSKWRQNSGNQELTAVTSASILKQDSSENNRI